jgi:hypothetical protein
MITEALLPRPLVLAELVEAEAAWENIPVTLPPDVTAAVAGLRAKQAAYDAYRAKLVAFNARFKPGHVGGGTYATPARLAAWCRKTRDIFRELDPAAPCPVHLMAKARRFAGRVAALTGGAAPSPTAPSDVGGAIRELDGIADWCDGLARQ